MTSQWHGTCDLRLYKKPKSNNRDIVKTIHQAKCTAPLKLMRVFNDKKDGRCEIPILHSAGGIVGGDQLTININAEEGLRFQNSNINDGDKFNLKVIEAGTYLIEIEDHFKNVISKSTLNAKSGDNVYTFYTRAFQDGDYTITISLNGDTKHNVKYTIQ